MNKTKPRIALVLGDPCGIGPELAVKLLAEPETMERADIIVVSGLNVFEDGLNAAGVQVEHRLVEDAASISAGQHIPLLLSSPTIAKEDYELGEVSERSGKYQLDCLATGLELCRNGHADAMCFAPLNKEAMHLAGLEHEDESGFFIEKLGHQGDFGLLNTLGNLWTSRATSHVSHRQVSELLNEESILEATRLLHAALLASGNKSPKIAVAGLNPHAGDGGMFGTEEIDIIEPAVRRARQEGIEAEGPFPPDTIFLLGRDGTYDAIVTMYHDQGQIAMKLMGFERGVTVHAGLPFPVTTSAHGSAMDIAGKGIANVNALKQAFLLASSMAL
jgi:4-hydroxythreonine-4-phosphate dehydrogenase